MQLHNNADIYNQTNEWQANTNTTVRAKELKTSALHEVGDIFIYTSIPAHIQT